MARRLPGVLHLAAVVLVAAAGCAKEKMPEIGHVTGVLKAKGQPAKGMIITFMPDPGQGNNWPINATATTDAQGKYELGYGYKGQSGAGAPVGWHVVVVMDTRYSSIPQGAPLPPRLFSTAYSAPNTSPLRAEVKLGENAINLDVK